MDRSTDTAKDMIEGVENAQFTVYRFLSELSNDPTTDDRSPSVLKEPVKIIHTHSAHLFLLPDLVYKIKRAVTYSYLDMSTLDKRRQLCERELELNQPGLPDIYLDVVPITLEADGSLAIDGCGEPVEWALRMNRFDEELVLENLAQKGKLTLGLSKSLGHSLAQFHAQLPSAAVLDGHKRIHEVVVELIGEFAVLGQYLPEPLITQFSNDCQQQCDHCRTMLDLRGRNGFIRRCHGDLHLRNLLVHDGTPVPFDALEFDERMATIDIFYDLAFLLMDLEHRGLFAQQNVVLNEYLLHSDDGNIDALMLLPLFLSCRSAIRAMTSAQAAAHDPERRQSLTRESAQYLELAISYLDSPKPRLVAIGGLSGSGKSTIASRLAHQIAKPPGALQIRSDVERKLAAGLRESDTLPATYYTAANARCTYSLMITKARKALNAGHSVIVDATFLSPQERHGIEELAHQTGIAFTGLWLTAAPDRMRHRITSRSDDDASDATLSVLNAQIHEQSACSEVAWHHIDANDDIDTTLERCRRVLV